MKRRHRPSLVVTGPVTILAAFFAAALGSACAETAAEARADFAPSFATSGESFQTSYVSRGPSAVTRVNVDADLVVRPDRVCIPVQIWASADDAGAAMQLVKGAADKLGAAAGTLRIDDIDARSDRTADGVRSSVSMRGVIEAELADGDAWARAQQVAALSHAAAAQATWEAGKLLADDKPRAHVLVGAPEPGVRDVEAHREKLLARWGERAKALASIADGAALELVNCAPPAQVVVVGGTLEKVGLSLPVQCTFTVKK